MHFSVPAPSDAARNALPPEFDRILRRISRPITMSGFNRKRERLNDGEPLSLSTPDGALSKWRGF
jgi:hypothetical protein